MRNKKKNNNKIKKSKHSKEQSHNIAANQETQNNTTSLKDLTTDEFKEMFVSAQIDAAIRYEKIKKEEDKNKRKNKRQKWYNLIGYVDYSDKKGIKKILSIIDMYIFCPVRACWIKQEQLKDEEVQLNSLKDLPCFLLFLLECFYYLLSLFFLVMAIMSFIKQILWYGILFVLFWIIMGVIARDGPRLERIKLRVSNDEQYIDRAYKIASNVVMAILTVAAAVIGPIIANYFSK